ncbi:MAG TPA: hypothetical protein VJH37_01495 [Candidatus Nanoarchaeia archaeon]|nr:hypothetical protein [Candidatus Nanoarchaeia archaeon]
MKSVKKGEQTLVTTAFSNSRSMITFFVAVFVLLSLFVIMHSYSTLVEERTIEVNSGSDLSLAKEKLQSQVAKLEREIGELRALIN